MQVELVAYTVIDKAALSRMGYVPHDPGTGVLRGDVSPGDELTEVAGRECYQSWRRPNPGTATNIGYVKNIVDKGHFSVMEHASYTFSVRGVSRALTHELVRHRHLAFSMLSQRYVDESEGEFVVPLDVTNNASVLPDLLMTDFHQEALDLYNKVYAVLTESGVSRKRARQAARAVLPNGHSTRLLVTGNIRAWREVLTKRLARDPLTEEPLADLEIFQFAWTVLYELFRVIPASVWDIWEKNKPVVAQPPLEPVPA